MKSIVLAMGVLTAPLSTVAAPPAEQEVVPASENAAIWYWQSWLEMAEPMTMVRTATYTADGLDVPEDSSEEEVMSALRDSSYAIDLLIHASKMELCDFGSRPDHGLSETRMHEHPHLRPSRAAANLLAVDAGRMIEQGESEGAADRLATIFRMSEHISRNETLIPTLVGAAIFEVGAAYTERFHDKLSESDRQIIAEALKRYPAEDPFRMVVSVRTDAAAGAKALTEQIQTGQIDGSLLEGLGADGVLAQVESEMGSVVGNTRAARLARARLVRDAMQVEKVGESIAEAWDNDAEIETIARDAASGEYGVFAPMMTGPYERLRKTDVQSRAKLNALRAWANGETETLELPERNRR